MAMRQIEQLVFYHFFSTCMDTSLHREPKLLKFCLCVLCYHIEGTVSQILYLGLRFCFMKSRKSSLKT